MAQIVKLTASIAAGASDQAVAHGLPSAPVWVYIVEKDEAAGAKKALYAQCFTKVASVIGLTKPKVKMAAAAVYTVAGVHYAKALTDNFWVLTGFNVTNAMYNLCLLCIDDNGDMQIAAGTEAATLVAVVLPDTPADSCVVAMLEVNPTGTGNFVGGTTDLDDATVVPNAVYSDLGGHPDLFAEITLGASPDVTNVYVDSSMQSARDIKIIAASTFHSIVV